MWGALIRIESIRRPTLPVNPRPPGQIEADGATAMLLRALADTPDTFMTYREIHKRLSSPKSLNWALRYCRAKRWIEVTSDPRSARYRRYRITSLGMRLFHD